MQTRAPHPPTQETAEQVLAAAQTWYRRQVEILRNCHGTSWPDHKTWLIDYLREEVRLRLIARGWRPIDGR